MNDNKDKNNKEDNNNNIDEDTNNNNNNERVNIHQQVNYLPQKDVVTRFNTIEDDIKEVGNFIYSIKIGQLMFEVMHYWSCYIYPIVTNTQPIRSFEKSIHWLYLQDFEIRSYSYYCFNNKSDQEFWNKFNISTEIRQNIGWQNLGYPFYRQNIKFKSHNIMMHFLLNLRRLIKKYSIDNKQDMLYFVDVTTQWTIVKKYRRKFLHRKKSKCFNLLLIHLPNVLTDIVINYTFE